METKKPGARDTAARRAILAALAKAPHGATAEELLAKVRKTSPSAHKTTVYRRLYALRDAGEVTESASAAGPARYELAGDGGHHHHFTCVKCGAPEGFESPAAEKALEDAARRLARAGFRVTGHALELFGECPSCSSKNEK